MTRFAKNIICSMFFGSFRLHQFVFHSIFIILSVTLMDFGNRVPENQIESWATLHWLLGLCCVTRYTSVIVLQKNLLVV